ncbi:hypothetical protein BJV82DRAFT_597226 [Fennellomyces sp. T-0311]|nr:hypothetical protein BJV82DRAFT_597226 [Fennellomyces sp. T-0311]
MLPTCQVLMVLLNLFQGLSLSSVGKEDNGDGANGYHATVMVKQVIGGSYDSVYRAGGYRLPRIDRKRYSST